MSVNGGFMIFGAESIKTHRKQAQLIVNVTSFELSFHNKRQWIKAIIETTTTWDVKFKKVIQAAFYVHFLI